MTGLTLFLIGKFQFLCASKNCFLKSDPNTQTYIRTFLWTIVCASSGSSAKEIAKNIAEDIAHIHAGKIKTAGSATCTAVECGMTKLIILTSLVRIAQYCVGFLRLFELFLAFLIARMQVRVVGLSQLAVGFFDLVLGCTLFDTEHFIIISFFSHT